MIRSELVQLLARDNPDLAVREIERLVTAVFEAVTEDVTLPKFTLV